MKTIKNKIKKKTIKTNRTVIISKYITYIIDYNISYM